MAVATIKFDRRDGETDPSTMVPQFDLMAVRLQDLPSDLCRPPESASSCGQQAEDGPTPPHGCLKLSNSDGVRYQWE